MIERKTQEMSVARQLFKSYGFIIFRIYARKKPLPKVLQSVDMVYELKIQTIPPFEAILNGNHAMNFLRWREAYSTLSERVRTISRQFGFVTPISVTQYWKQPIEVRMLELADL